MSTSSHRSLIGISFFGFALLFFTSEGLAQSFGGSSPSGYGISPTLSYGSPGALYLPFGQGGFVPYSGGPGGGLGTLSRPRPVASMGNGMGADRVGGTMGRAMSLGQPRSAITPLVPLQTTARGARGGMAGMPLIQRATPSAGMSNMVRPPVGNYPFRQPPSPTGQATASTLMSM